MRGVRRTSCTCRMRGIRRSFCRRNLLRRSRCYLLRRCSRNIRRRCRCRGCSRCRSDRRLRTRRRSRCRCCTGLIVRCQCNTRSQHVSISEEPCHLDIFSRHKCTVSEAPSQECCLFRRDRKCIRIRRHLETERQFSILVEEHSLRAILLRSSAPQKCLICCRICDRCSFTQTRIKSQNKLRNSNGDLNIALDGNQVLTVFCHIVDQTGIRRTQTILVDGIRVEYQEQ